MLEDQIKDADALLQSKNVTIDAVNGHINLREELAKHGLSIDDTYKLVNLLVNAKQYDFEPKKIVALRPLERKENRLRNNCTILAKHLDRYKEIIPLVDQIVAMRIGVDELFAFHASVMKKADMQNLPIRTAAYRVIEDVQNYNKLGDMKKQLSDIGMQIYQMNQFSARQNEERPMMALFKLQGCGVTEDQIFDLCRHFEKYGKGIADLETTHSVGTQYISDASFR
jgi:hypothetical protein